VSVHQLPPFDAPIYVARPRLPDFDSFVQRLRTVWESAWLTNGGAQQVELEKRLQQVLGVPGLALFNNGTTALLTACRALSLRGEVITTPFTFPATPHVLSWLGVTPVFADIDPVTLNIDPERIEALITERTTAILGVHVYGVPCDVVALEDIARHRGLKLVYDAAHAFGVRLHGRGIGTFGDASAFSFHATKAFHTAEGGALACRAPEVARHAALLRNFGILNEEEVEIPGLNGKMNELQAALGLAVLDELP
jgi:dTDP-4-amino-4,6-dideoxygalactose transaminase